MHRWEWELEAQTKGEEKRMWEVTPQQGEGAKSIGAQKYIFVAYINVYVYKNSYVSVYAQMFMYMRVLSQRVYESPFNEREGNGERWW